MHVHAHVDVHVLTGANGPGRQGACAHGIRRRSDGRRAHVLTAGRRLVRRSSPTPSFRPRPTPSSPPRPPPWPALSVATRAGGRAGPQPRPGPSPGAEPCRRKPWGDAAATPCIQAVPRLYPGCSPVVRTAGCNRMCPGSWPNRCTSTSSRICGSMCSKRIRNGLKSRRAHPALPRPPPPRLSTARGSRVSDTAAAQTHVDWNAVARSESENPMGSGVPMGEDPGACKQQ